MTEENKNPIEELETKLRGELKGELETVKNENENLRSQIDKIVANGNAPETRSVEDEHKVKVRNAFEKLVRSQGEQATEFRDLTGNSTTGKYGVPVDMDTDIIAELQNENSIRNFADVGRTESDTALFLTRGNVGASWGAGEPSKQKMSGGPIQSSVKDLKALVALPINLINDTAVDIILELRQAASEAIGETELSAMTSNSNPEAVEPLVDEIISAGNVNDSGSGGALGADDDAIRQNLVDIAYKIHQKERNRAKWMMNSQTLARYVNVYHPNGGPIYDSANNKLLGREVIINEEMDDISVSGSTTTPVIFGNFKAYGIRDRKNVEMQILDQPYRAAGEIGYLFETRLATKLKRASAFQALQVTTA